MKSPWLVWSHRYFKFGLIVIAAFAFVTRVWRVDQPPTYIFDEVYHAVTAKLIAHNDYREPNTAIDWLHPPIAKYTQALSMLAWGENAFGWRFSSVVAGTLVVIMTGWVSYQLFRQPTLSWLAASLAAFDGLLLAQSRIAMNDIHVTLMILITISLYLWVRPVGDHNLATSPKTKWPQLILKWLAVGVAAGVTAGTKWSGVFVIGVIGLREAWWFLSTIIDSNKPRHELLGLGRLVALKLVMLLLIPALTYVACYTMFFTQGRNWADFRELHRQIWVYQTTLKATHSFQSRPYQWWLNLRPVWLYVEYGPGYSYTEATSLRSAQYAGTITNIYAQGNPALFWLGDIALLVTMVAIYLGLKDQTKLSKGQFQEVQTLIFLIITYFLVWLPWQQSPRIMFFYHYATAVPWLCMILAFWLNRVLISQRWNNSEKSLLVGLPFAVIATAFILWYPNWTGLPVSSWWANQVYFALPSWK
jgi:dolichyl-phosphate-mannose-protein mannosyltransferase